MAFRGHDPPPHRGDHRLRPVRCAHGQRLRRLPPVDPGTREPARPDEARRVRSHGRCDGASVRLRARATRAPRNRGPTLRCPTRSRLPCGGRSRGAPARGGRGARATARLLRRRRDWCPEKAVPNPSTPASPHAHGLDAHGRDPGRRPRRLRRRPPDARHRCLPARRDGRLPRDVLGRLSDRVHGRPLVAHPDRSASGIPRRRGGASTTPSPMFGRSARSASRSTSATRSRSWLRSSSSLARSPLTRTCSAS